MKLSAEAHIDELCADGARIAATLTNPRALKRGTSAVDGVMTDARRDGHGQAFGRLCGVVSFRAAYSAGARVMEGLQTWRRHRDASVVAATPSTCKRFHRRLRDRWNEEESRATDILWEHYRALVGAGVALLMAPKSGAQTREELSAGYSSVREAAARRYRDLAERATVKLGELEQKVDQYEGNPSSSTGTVGDTTSTSGYPRV